MRRGQRVGTAGRGGVRGRRLGTYQRCVQTRRATADTPERVVWRFDLVTSEAVLDELRDGDYPSREKALKLVEGLPLLEITPAIAEIVEVYIQHELMPADPAGDALHLALASYHKCEFLLTWNCQHLANANKFDHIRRVNNLLGLYVPVLATPLEFIGDDDEQESGSDDV